MVCLEHNLLLLCGSGIEYFYRTVNYARLVFCCINTSSFLQLFMHAQYVYIVLLWMDVSLNGCFYESCDSSEQVELLITVFKKLGEQNLLKCKNKAFPQNPESTHTLARTNRS